jgi:rhodanese-related sulfurtransferase
MTSVLRFLLALAATPLILGIASCDTSEAEGTVVRVDAREAVRLIGDGRHTVVDLRSPEAFAAGHVAGAVNIDASAPDFQARVDELDQGVVYVVYAHDKDLSAPAADAMVRAGIDRVVDAGGFGLLALAGAELER